MWRFFKGDFLIYAGAKVLVGVSSFVLLGFLTRAMNPTQYANFALIFAIITLVTTVVTSWQTNSAIRFLPIAIEKDRQRSFDAAFAQVGVATTAAATAATAVVLAIAGELGFVELSATAFAASLGASAAGSAFQLYSIYGYSGRQRVLYSLLLITQIVLFMAGAVVVSRVRALAVELALLSLAISFLLPLIVFRMPLPSLRKLPNRTTQTLALQFFRYGAPLIVLNFAIQLNTYLDQFMLRALTDLHQVGLYAANYVVADKIIYALASVTSVALGPLIFREWENGDRAATYQMIWKAVVVFLTISIPIFACMLLAPDLVMSFITQPEYADGRVIIPYVMLAAFFSGAASIIAYVQTLLLRTTELAYVYITGTILNFFLDLILIPKMGILGCAYSTMISFISIFLILLVRAHKLSRFLLYLPAAVASISSSRVLK